MENKCIECSGKITYSYSGFCSKECYAKTYYRRKPVDKICRVCGVSYVGKRNSSYCSDACRVKGFALNRKEYRRIYNPKQKVDLICVYCGVSFTNYVGTKYCGKICRERVRQKAKSKYKIDKTGKTCEFCGFSDTRAIHAHHINRSDGLGVMFLCANHHYIFHSIVGNGVKSENNSKEEVLDVLKK